MKYNKYDVGVRL